MTTCEDRNKDQFKNWQFFSVWNLLPPALSPQNNKAHAELCSFTNPCINLLVPPSVTHKYHLKVLECIHLLSNSMLMSTMDYFFKQHISLIKLRTKTLKFFFLYVEHMLCATSSSGDVWRVVDGDLVWMCSIYTLFINCFHVGKIFLQLLSGATRNARDMLCSLMLEISILHVTSKIWPLFLTNIYITHATFFALHFSAEISQATFSLNVKLSWNYLCWKHYLFSYYLDVSYKQNS